MCNLLSMESFPGCSVIGVASLAVDLGRLCCQSPLQPQAHQSANPPIRLLVADLMQFTMMTTAEQHGELITHLETDRPRLCKAQVVWI